MNVREATCRQLAVAAAPAVHAVARDGGIVTAPQAVRPGRSAVSCERAFVARRSRWVAGPCRVVDIAIESAAPLLLVLLSGIVWRVCRFPLAKHACKGRSVKTQHIWDLGKLRSLLLARTEDALCYSQSLLEPNSVTLNVMM